MIFGLNYSIEESDLILLPVPWEVTVSYRKGTIDGPKWILESSSQVEVFDIDFPDIYKRGIHMLTPDITIYTLGYDLRKMFENKTYKDLINTGCQYMNDWVYQQTSNLLSSGKLVGLVGGDHSTPFGYIKALSDKYDNFGILQIDAHADLRVSYEDYNWSHASIMNNVLDQIPQMKKLIQIGIRDFCKEECEKFSSCDRITTFLDKDIKQELNRGVTWDKICNDIIEELPDNVYISFDIDGLDPKLCPNTGTPVPGGFDFDQIYYLLKLISDSGRKLIGFDLNEVSCGCSGEGIDSIIGARILYKLCNLLLNNNSR